MLKKEVHLLFGKGASLALCRSCFICFIFPLYIVCSWVPEAKGKELLVSIWSTLHWDAYKGKMF